MKKKKKTAIIIFPVSLILIPFLIKLDVLKVISSKKSFCKISFNSSIACFSFCDRELIKFTFMEKRINLENMEWKHFH